MSALGVLDLKTGEVLKIFKLRVKSDVAKVEIKFKSKGNAKRLIKSYKTEKGRPAVIGCIQAVCKYWPKFDPEKHKVTVLTKEEIQEVAKLKGTIK